MEPELQSYEPEPIHPWRWRFLAIWIAIFTLACGYAIRNNRESISQVKRESARVAALQKTNCGLARFLLTARKTRWASYLNSHDKADIQAVKGYEKLVEPFISEEDSVGECPISDRLKIKSRPIGAFQ